MAATSVADVETRVRIIEAAGEVFAEKGFDHATVRDICQAAGANIAAVNYYFGDKQRLYVAALNQAHLWRMQQAALPDWPQETSAEVKFVGFVRTFVARMLKGGSDTWHTRLMLREMIRPDSACAELVRDSIRPQHDLLISILRELLPQASEDRLELLAFSTVGQCLFYRIANPVVQHLLGPDKYHDLSVDTLGEHISSVMLAAIRAVATDEQRTATK